MRETGHSQNRIPLEMGALQTLGSFGAQINEFQIYSKKMQLLIFYWPDAMFHPSFNTKTIHIHEV